MKSLFVTATGTDVGKTFVCCRLLEALRSARPVRCIKPVVTGFDAAQAGQTDTGLLLAAQGLPLNDDSIDAVSPWRFRAALSADMAARREQRPIAFADLVRFSAAPAGTGLNLIEGIGGVMAPINDDNTVREWIAALDTDVLLVAGSYLGSLSHTLTALAALAQKSIAPAAIVLSQSASEPVPTAETAATLGRFTGNVPIITIPRNAKADAAEVAALLELLLPG